MPHSLRHSRRSRPRHHVSQVVLDDHLLREVLAGEQGGRLARLVEANKLATTNLYYVRLCKSVLAARGGQLTGGWSDESRRELGRRLLDFRNRLTSYRCG